MQQTVSVTDVNAGLVNLSSLRFNLLQPRPCEVTTGLKVISCCVRTDAYWSMYLFPHL